MYWDWNSSEVLLKPQKVSLNLSIKIFIQENFRFTQIINSTLLHTMVSICIIRVFTNGSPCCMYENRDDASAPPFFPEIHDKFDITLYTVLIIIIFCEVIKVIQSIISSISVIIYSDRRENEMQFIIVTILWPFNNLTFLIKHCILLGDPLWILHLQTMF